MELKERVYSVLVVSAATHFNEALAAHLPETEYSPVRIVTSISSAQRAIVERAFDIVLINAPLPDGAGDELAIDICTRSNAATLLFAKADVNDEMYTRLVEYGVFTLSKPAPAQLFSQALRWLAAARERLRRLEKRSVSLEDKMAEIRLINRAKWLLISNRGMSEPDAHRFIEKQAMDRSMTRRQIADEIIHAHG